MRARTRIFLINRQWQVQSQYPTDSTVVSALILKSKPLGFESSYVTHLNWVFWGNHLDLLISKMGIATSTSQTDRRINKSVHIKNLILLFFAAFDNTK